MSKHVNVAGIKGRKRRNHAPESLSPGTPIGAGETIFDNLLNRRNFLAGMAGTALLAMPRVAPKSSLRESTCLSTSQRSPPLPASTPRAIARYRHCTSFDQVHTDKLRREIVSDGTHSTGILEWQVYRSGQVPAFPPVVDAGVDRTVVLGGQTYLSGKADWLKPGRGNQTLWTRESGPGHVTFADAAAPNTTAGFSAPGD